MYNLMISLSASVVPIMHPAKPINPITDVLKIINAFSNPEVLLYLKENSKNAGNKTPRVLSANAPTNEINKSKFGIITAKRTMDKEKNKFFLNKFPSENSLKI